MDVREYENKYTVSGRLYAIYDLKASEVNKQDIFVRTINLQCGGSRPAQVMLDGLSLRLGIKLRL